MPFVGENWAQRSANITRAKYNYHESAFKEISDLAKDFVDHLLLLKPEYRMNASQALNHRWVREGPPCGAKAGHMKRTRENLKSYLANYRARWQVCNEYQMCYCCVYNENRLLLLVILLIEGWKCLDCGSSSTHASLYKRTRGAYGHLIS